MKTINAFVAILVVATTIFLGIYLPMMLIGMRPAMDQTTTSTSFSVMTKGTISADSSTHFSSINNGGKFCLTKEDGSITLCSQPSPRPDNSIAHSLDGELSTGTWNVTEASDSTFIESDKPLSHNNNNRGGFIGICAIFGGMYLFVVGACIKMIKITFRK